MRVAPEKIIELEDAFKALDADKDGNLTLKEIKAALAKFPDLGSVADIDKIFAEIDHDGSGMISIREFIAATLDSQDILVDEVLWDAFTALDKDGSGTVCRKELEHAVRNVEGRLGHAHVDNMIDLLCKEID